MKQVAIKSCRFEVIRLSKVIHEKGLDSRAGKKAIEKLVRHNLKLIPGIVRKAIAGRKKFKFGDDHTIDLLQAGVFGLTRAAEKFDYRLGYKFSNMRTYVGSSIRAAAFIQALFYDPCPRDLLIERLLRWMSLNTERRCQK